MVNRFASQKNIFGKYDIRGIYPGEIDEILVADVASALASKVFKKGPVILGHDARNSSPSLYKAAYEALGNKGVKVLGIGMMTTPMLIFFIKDLNATGGIMITASHNPGEYNGIKAATEDGSPISGEDIYKLL